MNPKYQNLYKIFFAFADLAVLNVINLGLLFLIDKHAANLFVYAIFCIFSNISWMICSYTSAMYLTDRLSNFRRLVSRTLAAFIFYNCFLFLFGALSDLTIRNTYLYYDLGCFAIFLFLSRAFYIMLMTTLYRSDQHRKKIAFIGCNKHVLTLINHFQSHRQSTEIAGVFNDNQESGAGLPFLGDVADCVNYAREHKITEIYSTLSPKAYPALYALAQSAEQSFIRFRFVPDLSDYVDTKCKIDFIDDTAVISLRNEPLADISGQLKKRIFDVVVSSLILVFILSWLLPILGLLIKLTSKGPVFFTQLRSGKNNIPFRVIKLRTLRINEESESKQVTRGDQRITPIGRFLRKTNLDELPQFLNVLAGDMSIIGSRPHMLKHTEEYAQLYDNYMLRHYTKPGITGWAQVNGYRGEIKEPGQLRARVEHDIWYMENWSIWLDFKIVSLTVLKTLTGDKNAF
jgi:putative colanic acid biosynthesis UDP-glucose lipid carrier transferase